MKQCLILVLGFAWSSLATASQVLWDVVELWPGVHGVSLPEIHWQGSCQTAGNRQYDLQVLCVLMSDSSGSWTLRAEDYGFGRGILYQSNSGELVGQGSCLTVESVFVDKDIKGVDRTEWVGIHGESAHDSYLSIVLRPSNPHDSNIEVYGWLQLGVRDGEIQLLHSALDLDGGPMIVGGGSALTPEPSSTLLLLLGLCVLGLRRRRLSGFMV